MGIILLVLLLALILGGLGFAIHILWWIALIVLVIWLIGFVVRSTWHRRLLKLSPPWADELPRWCGPNGLEAIPAGRGGRVRSTRGEGHR